MKIIGDYEYGYTKYSLVEMENQYFLVENIHPTYTEDWVRENGLLMPDEDALLWLDAVKRALEQRITYKNAKLKATYYKKKLRKLNNSLARRLHNRGHLWQR